MSEYTFHVVSTRDGLKLVAIPIIKNAGDDEKAPIVWTGCGWERIAITVISK